MSCQGCAAVCCLLPCISWAFWGHDYWFTLSFFEFGVLSYALFSCSSISSINTLLSLVFRFSRFSFLLPALMFLVSCLCVVFPLCYFRFYFVSFCHLHQFPCCCTCKAVVTFPEQLCVFILSVQCCIILCLPTVTHVFPPFSVYSVCLPGFHLGSSLHTTWHLYVRRRIFKLVITRLTMTLNTIRVTSCSFAAVKIHQIQIATGFF